MHNSQRIYELQKIKRDKLKEVLETTKNTKLTATKESINDYINLIYTRKILFDYIFQVEKEIEILNFPYISGEPYMIDEVISETNEIISDILKCDYKNNIIVDEIMNVLRKNLKQISGGKILYSYYQSNSNALGWYFDKKK